MRSEYHSSCKQCFNLEGLVSDFLLSTRKLSLDHNQGIFFIFYLFPNCSNASKMTKASEYQVQSLK